RSARCSWATDPIFPAGFSPVGAVRRGRDRRSRLPLSARRAISSRGVPVFLRGRLRGRLRRGGVARAGFSPWPWPPADPRLAGLAPALSARVAHRDIRTVYPPVAQAVFH